MPYSSLLLAINRHQSVSEKLCKAKPCEKGEKEGEAEQKA